MKTLPLGSSGEQVSAMCLGLMNFGTRQDDALSSRLMDMYIDAGGSFLDTANVYAAWVNDTDGGESEALLGRWMKDRGNRADVFIATKVGSPVAGRSHLLTAENITREVEASLKRMQTDYVDLYYAHRDDFITPQEEYLAAMNALVETGKVRYIACSNWVAWRMEGAYRVCEANGWPRHVAVQEKHSYLTPRAGWKVSGHPYLNQDLLDFCAYRDVTVVAYSPLAKGAYTRADKQFADVYSGPDNEARLAALKTVSEETGATANQVVLAWLMAQTEPAIIPLFAASNAEQMTENLGALDVALTDDQLTRLSEAGRG